MSLITAAIKGNAERKKQMAGRILDKVKDVKNPKIAVLGLAFKDGTDDCRESPAMDIVGELLLQGADITAYDPKAMGTACGLLGNKISYADDMYACLKDADVLAILTEWNEFKALDLVQAAHLMRHKQIVDCRNLINAEQAAANGFDYQGIGKNQSKKVVVCRRLRNNANTSRYIRKEAQTLRSRVFADIFCVFYYLWTYYADVSGY